ncbi:MAG TPA: hypothetical protein VEA40_24380 [Ramlibacter sp.]|nr:hypothetical protein [Ramlibacter sp.]
MTDDRQRAYEDLLAREQEAWRRLRASRRGGEYDPALLAEWLAWSRQAAAARSQALDGVMQEDPGLMHRPLARPDGGGSA